MSLAFEFHPDVEIETDAGYRWYQQRRIALGQDFLDELEKTLAQITANPASFGFASGDIREGLLSRFPYAIYYRVLTDRIRILAVFHTSRDPSIWQSRV